MLSHRSARRELQQRRQRGRVLRQPQQRCGLGVVEQLG
nr:MAG TPA: hypothetical protein [Caudoviricetes sp.]